MNADTENQNRLDTVSFILAVEDGSITYEQFEASAQSFVDSGVWRSLQGSWQRAVGSWVESGAVCI